MDPCKMDAVSSFNMCEEPCQEIRCSVDLPPVSRRELKQIEERISHSLHISDDNLYEETYQEIQRSGLRSELGKISNLISKTQVMPHRLQAAKTCLLQSINVHPVSKEEIYSLDKETCCTLLLLSTQNLVPQLRPRLSEKLTGTQPWESSRIELQELSPPEIPIEMFMNDSHDYLHTELLYMRQMYLPLLLDKHIRLEGLMSKDQVLAQKLGSLKLFLEKCMNLLYLRTTDLVRIDKKQCRRLVQMTKLFVVGSLIKECGNACGEQAWPCEDLSAISELLQQVGPALVFESASSAYKCPPEGVAFPEGDWYHQAYKELLLTRKEYSWQLDEAYSKDYTGRLCTLLIRASRTFLEKSLEFLATSKAEIILLSKEKCYYQMMLIKLFVFLTKGSVSANQTSLQPQVAGSSPQTSETASSNSICRNELQSSPNKRDWVYEELRGIRKNHSSELDEAYRTLRGAYTQKPELPKILKVFDYQPLEEVLAFLGYARADLALLSEEECIDRLMRMKAYLNWSPKFESAEQYELFLKSFSDSSDAIKPESLWYWRDEVYAEIKSKKTKFMSDVVFPSKEVLKFLSQTPGIATELAQLNLYVVQALPFFRMNRCELALCSEEKYDGWAASVNRSLFKVRVTLTKLQISIGRPTAFPCNTTGAMLKSGNGSGHRYPSICLHSV